jgi:hypothetical protein
MRGTLQKLPINASDFVTYDNDQDKAARAAQGFD